MLHRHALLFTKDVFLKSVTIKNITPLLHSSSSTDLINPRLFEEDDDDTESATIQEEGHECSHLKTDTGDLVSGMKQLGSLRRVICSRKLASLPGDNSDPALTTPSTMPYILSLCI